MFLIQCSPAAKAKVVSISCGVLAGDVPVQVAKATTHLEVPGRVWLHFGIVCCIPGLLPFWWGGMFGCHVARQVGDFRFLVMHGVRGWLDYRCSDSYRSCCQ